jgi:arylsulfatase B
MQRSRFLAGTLLFTAACGTAPDPDLAAPGTPARVPLQAPPGNVLIVVADDLGIDKLGLYGMHTEVPRTPTIDALAAQGVTFTKAYANPLCSATRAAMLTGRRSWRTGVGKALLIDDEPLDTAEVTLPEMIALGASASWDASFAGKWHLGTLASPSYRDDPNDQGFGWYGGLLTSVNAASDGLPQDYWDWEKTTQGTFGRTTTYMTTDTADDAIARIATMPEPWLLVVSFHAPHSPYHLPPLTLVPSGRPYPGTSRRRKSYNLMVEAFDTELDRVLAALSGTSLDTTVVLSGDNGTPDTVMEPGFPHGKSTVYEGGVRIPLIVAGPEVGVPGSTSDALVEIADVFATVADLAEVDLAPLGLDLDAVSFLPQVQDPAAPGARATALSEWFDEDFPGVYAGVRLGVRNDRYRLVRVDGVEELYDLGDDLVEGADLLQSQPLDPDAAAAYAELTAAVPQHWVDLGY